MMAEMQEGKPELLGDFGASIHVKASIFPMAKPKVKGWLYTSEMRYITIKVISQRGWMQGRG
jgi:hypothetical protein